MPDRRRQGLQMPPEGAKEWRQRNESEDLELSVICESPLCWRLASQAVPAHSPAGADPSFWGTTDGIFLCLHSFAPSPLDSVAPRVVIWENGVAQDTSQHMPRGRR